MSRWWCAIRSAGWDDCSAGCCWTGIATSCGSRRGFSACSMGSSLASPSGGGWGVGDLEGATGTCLRLPGATVVCLTARNEPLRTRLASLFAGEASVRVLGFTEQMSELLAAADAIVHSTGGVTCLEALVRGCPIVAYGGPPGHAPKTARAMASLGLAEVASSPTQLLAALRRALAQPSLDRPRLAPAPAAVDLILAAEPRRRPAPVRRRRRPHPAAAAAAVTLILGGWLFLSDDAYPLVAQTLDLEPISHVATERPLVALLLRAPAALDAVLLTALRHRHAQASFAFVVAPATKALQAITAAGDEPLPELRPGALTYWL